MPILHDKKEAIYQHEMLVKVLQNLSIEILESKQVKVSHLMEIFQKIYGRKKFSNETIDGSIVTIIKGYVNNDNIKKLIIEANLSQDTQAFVQNIVSK